MSLAIRHATDPVAAWAPLPALTVRRERGIAAMAALQGRDPAEIRRRFLRGHRAYVACWNGQPAAFGWVATRTAEIGELGSSFRVPRGERYLWNFVTLPLHRGLGIYPRLLDAIVRAESAEAQRFWIAYAPENHASASGIRKAGFTTVAGLSFDAAGRPAVTSAAEASATKASATEAGRLLGLPIVREPLAPCWRCIRAGRINHFCPPDACACDYQRAESGCDAAA